MTADKLLRWLSEGATMFIVAAASLFLLLYIGFGDGKRTYELTHIEKLTSQGLYLQNTIEKFVRDGLPLKQYAGFSKSRRRSLKARMSMHCSFTTKKGHRFLVR